MLTNIKVIKCSASKNIKTKSGDTYSGVELVYKDSKGDVRTKNIHEAVLKYRPELLASLKALKPDQETTMTISKNDKGFWDVLAFGEKVDSAPNAAGNAGGGARQSDTERTASITALNAVNNAALLLAHKVEKGSLEDVALKVIKVSQSLTAKLLRGDLDTPPEEKKEESKSNGFDDFETKADSPKDDDVDIFGDD